MSRPILTLRQHRVVVCDPTDQTIIESVNLRCAACEARWESPLEGIQVVDSVCPVCAPEPEAA